MSVIIVFCMIGILLAVYAVTRPRKRNRRKR